MMNTDYNPVLLDDSLNEVINEIQYGDPVLAELADSPRHQLAFRTFAWLKAGVLLGELLVERDLEASAVTGSSWMSELLDDPEVRARLEAEVQAVGYQVAAEPALVHARPVRPDPATRERFLKMAESLLASD
jgi:hypothetical protein